MDLSIIKSLLWDVKYEDFDSKLFQDFLADRIAEKGNIDQLNWYFEKFGFSKFIARVLTSVNTSRQTKDFWQKYLQY